MSQHVVFGSVDRAECCAAICKSIAAYSLEPGLFEIRNAEAHSASEWQPESPLSNYRGRQHLCKMFPADRHCLSLTSADMLIELCQEASKKAGSQGSLDTRLGPPQLGL